MKMWAKRGCTEGSVLTPEEGAELGYEVGGGQRTAGFKKGR